VSWVNSNTIVSINPRPFQRIRICRAAYATGSVNETPLGSWPWLWLALQMATDKLDPAPNGSVDLCISAR